LENTELVWSGTLEEAKTYWETATLPKGRYIVTIDFTQIPDPIFWLVKTAYDLELTLKQWLGQGLEYWEWIDKTLILHLIEQSPIVPAIIYAIVLAILAVVGLFFASQIFMSVEKIVEEAPLGTEVLLVGVGIALTVGALTYIFRRKRK